MRRKFKGDTNLSTLYHDIIFWLGKRYLYKFEGYQKNELRNIENQKILEHPIVQFMKELSRFAFNNNERGIIDNDTVQNALKPYSKNICNHIVDRISHISTNEQKKNFLLLSTTEPIIVINMFGLLKPEGKKIELISNDYKFIHLSFQEWFIAYSLKEQLISDKNKGIESISQLCTPQNLMIMKFLVGLVSRENQKELIEDLWTSIFTSVDEGIEIGDGEYIELIMDLVEQATNKEGQSMVPRKFLQVVDSILLNDLVKWQKQIIRTNYVSEGFVRELQQILNSNDKSEAILSIDILSNLEFNNIKKIEIIDHLQAKLKNIKTDDEILESIVYALLRMNEIDTIYTNLDDPRVRIKLVSMDILSGKPVYYRKVLIDKALENLNHVEPLVILANIEVIDKVKENISNDQKNQVIESLIDVLGDQSYKNKEIVEKSLYLLQKFGKSQYDIIDEVIFNLENRHLNLSIIRKKIDILGNIGGNLENHNIEKNIIEALIKTENIINDKDILNQFKIIKAFGKVGREENVFLILVKKLCHENNLIRNVAITAITNLTERNPQAINLNVLIDQLSGKGYLASLATSKAIEQISEKFPELIQQEVADILINRYIHYKPRISNAIAHLVGKRSDLIQMNLLINKINSEENSTDFLRCIKQVAEHYPNLIKQELVDFLLLKAMDNIITDNKGRSHGNYYHYENDIIEQILNLIIERRPELIQMDGLINELNNEAGNIRALIGRALKHVAEKSIELLEKIELSTLLNKFVKSDYFHIDDSIKLVFVQIIEKRPALIQQNVVEVLFNKLNSNDDGIRRTIVRIIQQVAKKYPQMIQMDKLIIELCKDNRYIRDKVAYIITQIVEDYPELIQIKIFVDRLNSDSVAKVFNQIVDKHPELIQIDMLVSKLGNQDWEIRKAVVKTIGKLTSVHAELIQNHILINKLNDNNAYLRESAIQSIGQIAQNTPELIRHDELQALLNKLADRDDKVRIAAAQTIVQIVYNCSITIEQTVIDSLLSKFNDGNSDVRREVANAFGQIVRNRPELIKHLKADIFLSRLGLDK